VHALLLELGVDLAALLDLGLQGFDGSGKLCGALTDLLIKLPVSVAQMFLDAGPYRYVGGEREAWNDDADDEGEQQQEGIVQRAGGERAAV
jgi:hypothetical protein